MIVGTEHANRHLPPHLREVCDIWPAAGSMDTEIRFSNRIGGPHAATDIQSGVQS